MTMTEQLKTTTGPAIDFADVQAAAERLRGVAHCTPVLTSRTLDAITGAQVYLKAESFQRIGAFKFRGAYNAISALDPETRARGVVTNSSGNHAQAVALSAQIFGIPATIVMPTDAPPAKIAATRGYGAEIVFYDRYKEDRAAIAERVAADLGATMIPPYDHPLVMAGNGTTALELIEEVGELDLLLVCLGGGGLLSGCATAAKALSPGVTIWGVEPAAGDDWAQSYAKGELVRLAQLPRTWHPEEAAGVPWRTAGEAAAGAPAAGWGADATASAWQPIPTQPNGPQHQDRKVPQNQGSVVAD